MITYRDGDIFTEQDLDGIVHQTNTRGHFGGGIAKSIREIYPKAHKASRETCEGKTENEILGTYDVVKVAPGFYIFNSYSQAGMGGDDRNTRYDVLVSVLEQIKERLQIYGDDPSNYGKPFKLGVPYGFGCGLAQGSWVIVEAIFKSVFEDSKIVEIVIVKNPKFADTVKK